MLVTFETIPSYSPIVNSKNYSTAFALKVNNRKIIVHRDGTCVDFGPWQEKDNRRKPVAIKEVLNRLISNDVKINLLLGEFADVFKSANS